jgi:parallel beta-helix repeat protein
MSIINTTDASTTPISVCTSIESPGYYYLTSNISGIREVSGWCINIYANNVVLDGNGYSIIGNGQGGGIEIFGSYNVTIKNIKISRYSIGTSFLRASNNVIVNVDMDNNDCGIDIETSSNIVVENVKVGSGEHGVFIYKSSNNIITNINVFNNSDSGLKLIESSDNTM